MFIAAARSDRRIPSSPMSLSVASSPYSTCTIPYGRNVRSSSGIATSITATSESHARRSVSSNHCSTSSVIGLPLPSRSGVGTGMMGPMHVHLRGPVDGPPILLIHGNCSSALYWEPLVRELPETWRIVMPDLRGYGESETLPVDGTRGLRDFADDVAAVLSDGSFAPGARPVVVGHSMGGGVAMQLLIDHPAEIA